MSQIRNGAGTLSGRDTPRSKEYGRKTTVSHLSIYKKTFHIAIVSMLLFAADIATAQRTSGLSADILDRRTLETQRKVEKLFDTGDYERAFFIYRNELAAVGDKYAQYMVGYMLLTGTGVDEDYAAAAAWYQLAAERGTVEFVAVRDLLLSDLTKAQFRSSIALYSVLRRDFGDLAILLASIKRDIRELDSRTGTRLRVDASPLTVIKGRGQHPGTSGDYYDKLYEQLEDRLQQIKEIGGFDELDTDPTTLNIHQLEKLVEERLLESG